MDQFEPLENEDTRFAKQTGRTGFEDSLQGHLPLHFFSSIAIVSWVLSSKDLGFPNPLAAFSDSFTYLKRIEEPNILNMSATLYFALNSRILDSACERRPRRHAHGYWMTSIKHDQVENFISRQMSSGSEKLETRPSAAGRLQRCF